MEQVVNKTMVTRAVVTNIQDESEPKEIKAKHLVGYDTPESVAEDASTAYTPDITATFDDGTIIYEIELDKTMPVEKWQLFEKYAKMKNGNFYLVVPDYLRKPVIKLIEEQGVNAGVVYFNTK